MLRDRILTALILIPLFLYLILFLPPKHFAIVSGILVMIGAWEWSGLMGIRGFRSLLYPCFIILLFIVLLFLFYNQLLSVPTILFATTIFWVIAAVFVSLYPRGSRFWSKNLFIQALMGVMVLIPCWVSLNFIVILPFGPYILLVLFLLVWGADTGAYFVGKKWGKTKIAPFVSPGKTTEGLVGALIATVVIVAAISIFLRLFVISGLVFLLLGFITVIFSVVGDLFESMLKRNVGIKDSSRLLPGHGGVLDRIDSLTAAAPIFALGLMFLGRHILINIL